MNRNKFMMTQRAFNSYPSRVQIGLALHYAGSSDVFNVAGEDSD